MKLDERTREMIEEVRALGREYIRPLGLESDVTHLAPSPDHPFYQLCARKGGLVSWEVGEEDPEDGALSWRPMRALLTQEEASYWDRGIALSLPGPGLGGAALRNTATPDQRDRFLQPFTDHSSAKWAAMAMTEPGAGSDVARIQTRARKDGDNW